MNNQDKLNAYKLSVYKWGVEYPTNGKKPDLPDDVVVNQYYKGKWLDADKSVARWISWHCVTAFRITDERYKPAEQGSADTGWHERGELPPVGAKCMAWFDDGMVCWHECEVIGTTTQESKNGYMAVSLQGDHDGKLIWCSSFRPLRTEREKLVDAVRALGVAISYGQFDALYDAGLLRLPEQSK